MRYPQNNNWVQTNDGNIFGVLNETRNVHFDKRGMVSLSRRPIAYYNSTADADFAYVLAINYFSDDYYILTDDEMFYGPLDNTSLTEITNTNAYNRGSDAVVCYSRLYVTGDTTVDYTSNGTSFTTPSITLTTGKHHPLCVFDSQPTYKLAIGNGNTVTLYDSSHNAATDVLTIPAEYEVTSIRYRNGYLYVGTKNLFGRNANVYIWNGSGSAAQYSVDAGSHWVFSMTEYGSSVAFVNSAGQLLLVSGSEAVQLAAFPIYYSQEAIWQGSSGLNPGGKVFNRGMINDGSRIYISIDGRNEGVQVPGMYSGLWCFDPNVGLYHKAGVGKTRVDTPSASALSGNNVTFTADVDGDTGDPIFVVNNGSMTGISDLEMYYMIKIDTDEIQFAESRADAFNGREITLGGTLGSPSFRVVDMDSGIEIDDARQGAVAMVNPILQPETLWQGGILYGSRTSSGVYAINCLAPAQSYGSFTTQRLYGASIITVWQRLYSYISGLYLANEKVIIKAKYEERPGLPIANSESVDWTDANTFSTQDLTTWGNVEVGDEVSIVSGYGAGKSAHITAITETATDFTIDLDESIGLAGQASNVLIDNFKKIGVITNTTPNLVIGEAQLNGIKNPWVQFRIEMRGYDISIPFLDIINKSDKME